MTPVHVSMHAGVSLSYARFDPPNVDFIPIYYIFLQHDVKHRINDFHCEQLIYFYFLLNSMLPTNTEHLYFGISKLCCKV